MTSVANDKADVVLAGEVNGGNHIVAGGDIDGVVDVVAQSTRLGLCGEGITALVGKVGLHDGRGGFNAAHNPVSFPFPCCDGACQDSAVRHTEFEEDSRHPATPHRRPHRRWDHGRAIR